MASLKCARCGKRQPAEQMVYSRFTRNHYCADFDPCDRRRIRNARKSNYGAVSGGEAA
jgi:hypothetical protein